MPFNFRLNVQQVFRRLGIQTGARLPQLEDNIQMSMIVTDLSRLVPAPIEPRGYAGVNIGQVLGNFSVCQLQSLAAGGVFVELILIRSGSLLPAENYLIDVTDTDLALPGVAGHINIGGTPVQSRFTAGVDIATTAGATIPASQGRQAILFPAGIFVPNQSFLSITTDSVNRRLDIALIYRELPSVEEAG